MKLRITDITWDSGERGTPHNSMDGGTPDIPEHVSGFRAWYPNGEELCNEDYDKFNDELLSLAEMSRYDLDICELIIYRDKLPLDGIIKIFSSDGKYTILPISEPAGNGRLCTNFSLCVPWLSNS